MSILRPIPKHRGCCVHPRSILLHQYTRDDVLEGTIERHQIPQTCVDNCVDPVVHLLGVVHILQQA
eukprot:22771-Eustigmatos_ZCMA.PRE.1